MATRGGPKLGTLTGVCLERLSPNHWNSTNAQVGNPNEDVASSAPATSPLRLFFRSPDSLVPDAAEAKHPAPVVLHFSD